MNIIKWRDTYSIGVEAMDLQHKTIIELINTLYNEIRNEESEQSNDKILEEMANYAEKHFKEEETLLETSKYPDLDNHKAIHQQYRDSLKSLVEKSKNSDDTAMKDVYTFLRQWWTQHIMTEDQEYGKFLKPK